MFTLGNLADDHRETKAVIAYLTCMNVLHPSGEQCLGYLCVVVAVEAVLMIQYCMLTDRNLYV